MEFPSLGQHCAAPECRRLGALALLCTRPCVRIACAKLPRYPRRLSSPRVCGVPENVLVSRVAGGRGVLLQAESSSPITWAILLSQLRPSWLCQSWLRAEAYGSGRVPLPGSTGLVPEIPRPAVTLTRCCAPFCGLGCHLTTLPTLRRGYPCSTWRGEFEAHDLGTTSNLTRACALFSRIPTGPSSPTLRWDAGHRVRAERRHLPTGTRHRSEDCALRTSPGEVLSSLSPTFAPPLSCAVKGCKKHEAMAVVCPACRLNFCLKHRFEKDHACAGRRQVGKSTVARAAERRMAQTKHAPARGSRGKEPSSAAARAVPRAPAQSLSAIGRELDRSDKLYRGAVVSGVCLIVLGAGGIAACSVYVNQRRSAVGVCRPCFFPRFDHPSRTMTTFTIHHTVPQ
jgi:hypothetical protein